MDLSCKKKDRKQVCNPSNKHVIPTLSCVLGQALAETQSFNEQLDEQKLRASYVCKPCFRSLEKLQKLQEQITTIQASMRTNAKKTVSNFVQHSARGEDPPESSPGPVHSGVKRPASQPFGVEGRSDKRRKLTRDTHVVASTSSMKPESPPMSVSHYSL